MHGQDTWTSISAALEWDQSNIGKAGGCACAPVCPLPPEAGRGGTPGAATPGPHGTASPRAGTGGGGWAGGAAPRCCGEWACGRAPWPPTASRTPAWPVPGVSAGATLAPRDSAGVTQGLGAPWPRQPHYRPPDGCCRAMAASQPRQGRRRPPFVIGDGRSALGLSFLPFIFPLPSGKQYLSAYIMLASLERPAASAADLSPLLRAVPGGAGGSERRSRAQGPSGSHAARPGPSPAPAPATAWERADLAPAPRGAPGWGPCAGSSVASRGASHRPFRAAVPGDGDPHPAEPGCLHRPGHAGQGHPLSRCSPSPRPAPGHGLAALPASSPLAVGGLAPSPLARSQHGPCRGWGLGCTRSRGEPAATASGAAGLPAPLPTLRSPLRVPAGWVPWGWGAGRDGERALLRARAQGSKDGCCGHTCTHPRLCRVSVGVTRTPHARDGAGCCSLC